MYKKRKLSQVDSLWNHTSTPDHDDITWTMHDTMTILLKGASKCNRPISTALTWLWGSICSSDVAYENVAKTRPHIQIESPWSRTHMTSQPSLEGTYDFTIFAWTMCKQRWEKCLTSLQHQPLSSKKCWSLPKLGSSLPNLWPGVLQQHMNPPKK